MKVVLFCGGLGMRIRDNPEPLPKPMISIGYRPILWHVMKYYAHFGHKDFILCLGYKADAIKNYFLNYDECVSNDFIISKGGRKIRLLNRDIQDWKITFVDTGVMSNIGQRLKAVEEHLEGESMFLANYSDGVTDLPLNDYIEEFETQDKTASFLAVQPQSSYHVVDFDDEGVAGIRPMREAGLWINGGYFIFRSEIFDAIHEGEELVEAPFQRLIQAGQLAGHRYEGFWACMDTFKDKQQLEDLWTRGNAPWNVWTGDNRLPPKVRRRGGSRKERTVNDHA